ncbi:CRE-GPA-11 protein [Aphelenchoides avenae]|nr:CRE-GPA-11 protein [Aphelenchus avenae]
MTADYGGGLFSWTLCGRRGVCWTTGADTYRSDCDVKELVRRNQVIEEQIRRDKIAQKKILKILLLGGPESGKSTIFKQMRILHMSGFSDLDMVNYRYLIYSNIVQSVRQLIEGATGLRIEIDRDSMDDVDAFLEYDRSTHPSEIELNADLCDHIKRIYKSAFIQKVLARQHEIVLLDSAVYFLENLDRIGDPTYSPTHQDVLRSRIPTAGINEIEFPYKHVILK